MLKKESGFKKISSDWKYGLMLIRYAGTNGLTGIHVKKTWILIESKLNIIQRSEPKKLRHSYLALSEK